MRVNRLIEEDARTFDPAVLPRMREAVSDLSFLIEREYAEKAALALVGDRWSLDARQRVAIRRAAASDTELARRNARRIDRAEVRGRAIAIDGYNVLTTIHCAEIGRALLLGRDGCFRDLAATRGNFENADLIRAAGWVNRMLAALAVSHVRWLLDDPVSGSGELAASLRHVSTGMTCEAATVRDPDIELIQGSDVCATSDSRVLEECKGWVNLARWTAEEYFPSAWVIDLATNL